MIDTARIGQHEHEQMSKQSCHSKRTSTHPESEVDGDSLGLGFTLGL